MCNKFIIVNARPISIDRKRRERFDHCKQTADLEKSNLVNAQPTPPPQVK